MAELDNFYKTVTIITIITIPIVSGFIKYLYNELKSCNLVQKESDKQINELKTKVATLETQISDHKENISDIKIDIKEINSKLELMSEIKADIKHLDQNIKQLMENRFN